jgi:hypothetical protein
VVAARLHARRNFSLLAEYRGLQIMGSQASNSMLGYPHQRAWERSPRHFERCSAKGGYAPAPAVPNIWYWCDKRTRWEGSGLELSVPPFRAAVRAARPGKHSGNKILGVTAATAELVSIAFVTKAPFFLKGQEPPHPARALQWANV